MKFYNKMDLIMFTSVADAAPQMIAESLMCGVPVVSFNVGNAKNIIKNETDGYVIENFNIEDFVEKSYKSLYDKPKSWASSKQRAERASKTHSLKLFQKKLNEIIKIN